MAKRPCSGCQLKLVMRGYCDTCKAKRSPRARTEERRDSAAKRGYGSKWQKARALFLAQYPVCVDPHGDHGIHIEPSSVVDHVIPHQNDFSTGGLFWSHSNWQALCKRCHDKKTATEDGGFGREKPKDGA